MRRVLTTALTLCLLIGITERAGAETRRHRECRYQSLEQASWTDPEVRKSIRCAAEHWRVPGGTDKALDVARCESGFEADARGPGTSAAVYQFIRSTWDHTVARFRELRRRWDIGTNVFNGRANVVMAIRKAHVDGWSAWACA